VANLLDHRAALLPGDIPDFWRCQRAKESQPPE